MKKEFHDFALTRSVTAYRGLKQSISSQDSSETPNALQAVISDAAYVLENLYTPENNQQFEIALNLLLNARQIFTLGMRSSRPLAVYCEHVLRTFSPHVSQLSQSAEYVYDRILLSAETSDVILVFSVWPCTRETVNAAEFCHKRGIPVVLITNTRFNPIVKYANAVIDTNSANHSSGATAIMAVVEAIAMELGRRTAPKSLRNIELIENVLSEKEIVLNKY